MLILRKLTKADAGLFHVAWKSWETPELANRWFSDWKPGSSFEEFLTQLDDDQAGRNLPEGFVPSTELFGFHSFPKSNYYQRIVGRLGIRHQLNDALKTYGGHIGYAVLPTERGKGYGYEMLLFMRRF